MQCSLYLASRSMHHMLGHRAHRLRWSRSSLQRISDSYISSNHRNMSGRQYGSRHIWFRPSIYHQGRYRHRIRAFSQFRGIQCNLCPVGHRTPYMLNLKSHITLSGQNSQLRKSISYYQTHHLMWLITQHSYYIQLHPGISHQDIYKHLLPTSSQPLGTQCSL